MRYTISRSKAAAYAEQLQLHIGELCNGSTYDSDSYCLGSNPSSPAISLHGQAVKTLPSQGKIMGSIPIGGATKQNVFVLFFCCSVFFKLSSPSVFIKSLYRILHLCQVFLSVPSFAFSMECAGRIPYFVCFFIMKRTSSDVFGNLDSFFIKCYTTRNVPIYGYSFRSVTIF